VAVSIAVAGCSLTARSGDAPPSPEPSASAATSAAVGPAGPAPDLLVLADGVQGSAGLWVYDESTGWTAIAPLAEQRPWGATATTSPWPSAVRSRSGRSPASGRPAPRCRFSWPAQGSAVVAGGGESFPNRPSGGRSSRREWTDLLRCGGRRIVSLLSPAPASAFSPLVAWIDADRLVALSTDAEQISRLAVIDTTGHSLSTLRAWGRSVSSPSHPTAALWPRRPNRPYTSLRCRTGSAASRLRRA